MSEMFNTSCGDDKNDKDIAMDSVLESLKEIEKESVVEDVKDVAQEAVVEDVKEIAEESVAEGVKDIAEEPVEQKKQAGKPEVVKVETKKQKEKRERKEKNEAKEKINIQNAEKKLLYEQMFPSGPAVGYANDPLMSLSKADFLDKARVGGPKGKEGSADFTRGKCAFARPCTVGWKSQNQPLSGGGGRRTPN
jgi:hypothetical protein